MRAETDGIVCSGADKKGTTTYALLDERAPRGEEPSREEALARLVRIYFRSHSPATLADFTWWSGLTATEARRAVASIAEELTTEHFGDREFFVFRNAAAAAPCDTTHLLPAYDQYRSATRTVRTSLQKSTPPKPSTPTEFSNRLSFATDRSSAIGNEPQDEGTSPYKRPYG